MTFLTCEIAATRYGSPARDLDGGGVSNQVESQENDVVTMLIG